MKLKIILGIFFLGTFVHACAPENKKAQQNDAILEENVVVDTAASDDNKDLKNQ